jgi:hypothetical protein
VNTPTLTYSSYLCIRPSISSILRPRERHGPLSFIHLTQSKARRFLITSFVLTSSLK